MTAIIQSGGERFDVLAFTPWLAMWAEQRTDALTPRRDDLIRDKLTVLRSFLECVNTHPGLVDEQDVQRWLRELAGERLAKATIYAWASRVSSFYQWALRQPALAQLIKRNPVILARPKAPQPYTSLRTKALADGELDRLLGFLAAGAAAGDALMKRDYALVLFYLLSGMRRQEIIRLRWQDIAVQDDDSIILTSLVKGGRFRTRQLAEPILWHSLLDYLLASARLEQMQDESPLWTRHDRAAPDPQDPARHQRSRAKHAGLPDQPLTSHAFDKRLKAHALAAGCGPIRIHQFRHTYARLIGELAENYTEVQDALGHRDPRTTKVYLERIQVQRDRFSAAVARRLKLPEAPPPEPQDS
ncbi:MAG TPA: site-specific integrase [Herpetosiphonaceae bacterium]